MTAAMEYVGCEKKARKFFNTLARCFFVLFVKK
jgi:hypothetical protein